MHGDHGIFMQAVRDRRKIILTYFSGEHNLNLTKMCVPIKYSPPNAGEVSDWYYLWDSEEDVGERLLGLTTYDIMYMELSDEIFDPAEYIISERD